MARTVSRACWSFLGFFRCEVVVRMSRSAARQCKFNGFKLLKMRMDERASDKMELTILQDRLVRRESIY